MVFNVLGISEPFENPKAVNLSPCSCTAVQLYNTQAHEPRFRTLALAWPHLHPCVSRDRGQVLARSWGVVSLLLHAVEYDFTV